MLRLAGPEFQRAAVHIDRAIKDRILGFLLTTIVSAGPLRVVHRLVLRPMA
jgi:hypothetical protein